MAQLGRRDLSETFVDDQSPTLQNSYSGHWTPHYEGNFTKWYLGTYTTTSIPGDTLSFSFTGTQLWLYGGLSDTRVSQDGNFITYPTAEYVIDGSPVGSQLPYFDSSKDVVYFKSQDLQDGPHTLKLTVKSANANNLFMIDWIAYTFIAGGSNSSTSPTPTPPPHQSHVGVIVGGAVGGFVGIALLVTVLYCFLTRRRRSEQAYYLEKPAPADMAIDEYHAEPFNPAVSLPGPSSATYSGQDPHSAISEGSSSWQLNPHFRQGGASTPTSMTQPRSGKAALIAQQHEDVEEPVQYEDSGVRFGPREEGEPRPSRLPKDVPPTYTQS